MQTVFRNPLAGPDILGSKFRGKFRCSALLVLGAGSLIGGGIGSVAGSWGIVGAAWIGSGSHTCADCLDISQDQRHYDHPDTRYSLFKRYIVR